MGALPVRSTNFILLWRRTYGLKKDKKHTRNFTSGALNPFLCSGYGGVLFPAHTTLAGLALGADQFRWAVDVAQSNLFSVATHVRPFSLRFTRCLRSLLVLSSVASVSSIEN